jgi:hypothetical protein
MTRLIHAFTVWTLCTLLSVWTSTLAAESLISPTWKLPADLSNRNTQISYQYAMQGRPHSGKIQGLSGRVWLADSDPRSVRGSLVIPPPELQQIGIAPLAALGDLLPQASVLPTTTLQIDRISDLCAPNTIRADTPCKALLQGRAKVASKIYPVNLPVVVQRVADGFLISGKRELHPEEAAGQYPMAALFESASVSFIFKLPFK